MDKFIYWIISLELFLSAWLQWYFNLSSMYGFVAWLITIAMCVMLLRLTSRWDFLLSYASNSWIEFCKVHWASLSETRAVSLSVSLMIAVFSAMLWLIDQLVVSFLTSWI